MLTESERNEALYNGRDCLSMCRMYPHLVDALTQTNTGQVYEVDEQMADLALQMTRIGLPVDSELRHEIGERLRGLRDSAVEVLRGYTEGGHAEEFATWVAQFFAAKARRGEPAAGSVRIGPTRARAAVEEYQRSRAEWKAYRKGLADDAPEAAEADTTIKDIEAALASAKLDLKASRFDTDEFDGLTHTHESAFEHRVHIRRADFELALAKRGVNFGAKVQQAAILRVAGVPLLKTTGKSNLPQIDKEVLKGFERHPAAKALLRYILTDKTISVYIEGEKRAGKSGGKSKPVMVTEDGYIHPAWGVHRITGRWNSSPNCFDRATEYLTDQGWVPVWQLKELLDVRVAQFNRDTCSITFVEPTLIVEKHHRGDMVQLSRRNIDLMVTPDHRLLLGKRSGVWEDVLASDFTLDRKIWLAGNRTDWGKALRSPAWIAFLCAAQADGSWNGSGWTFGLSRPRKIRRLRAALKGLNVEWSEKSGTFENPFKSGEIRSRVVFYVHACALGREVHTLLGDTKSFGAWLLDFDLQTARSFLEEIMYWDGSFTRGNCYSSSNRTNADWVQALFVLTGRRAHLRSYEGSSLQTKPNWQVDVCNRAHGWTTNTKVDRVPWDDLVYCVSVPSGYIVVRRNGKVMVVGQCQNWSKRAGGGEENLRAMICAPEGYTFVGADQKQLEARLVGAMSQCKYLIEVFRRGEDVHSAFAAVGFPDVWPKLAATFQAHKQGLPKGEKCHCATCAERDKVRDLTKRLEYGTIYGGQDKAIWEALVGDFPSLTQQQVRVFIASAGQMMPEMVRWREQTLQEAIRQGEIRSPILGRRQVFPLGRVDPTVAYNYKAQSGGADLWALGAIDFCARWNQTNQVDVRLIHNGHDSVLVLCRRDLAPQVERDVYECWSREWADMPFEMETKIADRWSET